MPVFLRCILSMVREYIQIRLASNWHIWFHIISLMSRFFSGFCLLFCGASCSSINICYFKLVKRESWSFFLNVSCGLKKNVYSVGWIVIQMSIRISWSVVFCRSSIAELIFYLIGNSVTVRGMLKSPIMIVDYFLLLHLLFLSHVF